MSETHSRLEIEGTSLEQFLTMLDERDRRNQRALREYIDSHLQHAAYQSSKNPSRGDKLYTEAEMVEMTGLSRQTLRAYRLAGILKSVPNLGRTIRYGQEHVDEFLRGQRPHGDTE